MGVGIGFNELELVSELFFSLLVDFLLLWVSQNNFFYFLILLLKR